jgi:hypothetical protein
MEKLNCCICQKPKATLVCGVCSSPVCKYCAQFLDEDTFKYLTKIPQEAAHTTYCSPCYNENVFPVLEKYNETFEQAKNILIFTKQQNKETRFIKRWEEVVHVTECLDREDVIMRLAFFAADAGFNGVIDIEIVSKKVRNGSYQTTQWSGSGIPAQVNPEKLVKDKSFTSGPN